VLLEDSHLTLGINFNQAWKIFSLS